MRSDAISVDSVRIELNQRTPSWCASVACMCATLFLLSIGTGDQNHLDPIRLMQGEPKGVKGNGEFLFEW